MSRTKSKIVLIEAGMSNDETTFEVFLFSADYAKVCTKLVSREELRRMKTLSRYEVQSPLQLPKDWHQHVTDVKSEDQL